MDLSTVKEYFNSTQVFPTNMKTEMVEALTFIESTSESVIKVLPHIPSMLVRLSHWKWFCQDKIDQINRQLAQKGAGLLSVAETQLKSSGRSRPAREDLEGVALQDSSYNGLTIQRSMWTRTYHMIQDITGSLEKDVLVQLSCNERYTDSNS